MSVKNWFWNWFGLVKNKTASASIPNAFPVGDTHESKATHLQVLHRGGAATQGGGGGISGSNASPSLFNQKESAPKTIKESLEPKEETEAVVEEPKPILETVTTDQSIVEKPPVKEKKAKKKSVKKEEPDEEEKLVNNKVISELERLQEYAKKKPIRLVMGTRRGDYIFLRFHEVKLIWMEVNPFNHRKRWKPVSDETIRSATAARRK